MAELIIYNQVPHLLSPVFIKLERDVPTLKWATREMERRYKVSAKHGCSNLDTYRQLVRKRADLEPMPCILIVIDELADLMMMAPDEIETQICRLAQMVRVCRWYAGQGSRRYTRAQTVGRASAPSADTFARSAMEFAHPITIIVAHSLVLAVVHRRLSGYLPVIATIGIEYTKH